jgi:hypothetical protein
MRPPIDDIETYWTEIEKAQAARIIECSVVGGRDTVREGVRAFLARTRADELMIVSDMFDPEKRFRSSKSSPRRPQRCRDSLHAPFAARARHADLASVGPRPLVRNAGPVQPSSVAMIQSRIFSEKPSIRRQSPWPTPCL